MWGERHAFTPQSLGIFEDEIHFDLIACGHEESVKWLIETDRTKNTATRTRRSNRNSNLYLVSILIACLYSA